jgi:hypothetical protein
MTEKKGRGTRRSDRPSVDLAAELKLKRDSFVQTFFKKGAEFTEELLLENERIRKGMTELEHENALLRTQLASDRAIRDLLEKIAQLETEKSEILSHMHEAEAVSTRVVNRHAQIEEEVANLASLHVASWHLHSTLKLPLVVRHLRELLAQLVGSRSFVIYLADFDEAPVPKTLVPVASDGMEQNRPTKLSVGTLEGVGPGPSGIVERVFLTGVPHIVDGLFVEAEVGVPAACLPIKVDDKTIGVIVIETVLAQKDRFVAVDFELFKMLGMHAGAALVAAQLYTAADGKLPPLSLFLMLDAHTSAPPKRES